MGENNPLARRVPERSGAARGGAGRGRGERWLWTLLGAAALALLWEAASRIYGSGLLLPGPIPALRSLAGLVSSRRFFSALWGSFARTLWGILIAVPLGIAAGIAAGLDGRLRAFFRPLFQTVAAVPVMSVILIAFLFLGSGRVPVFTAFLMVFPAMAANAMEGVNSADPKLKELFAAFGMSRRETLRRLYIPTLAPFLKAGLRSSLSLCWKAVVAAEAIVQPLAGLGTGMQEAKAHLETAELFAWTAATVCAAGLSQGLLTLAGKLFGRQRKRPLSKRPLNKRALNMQAREK